MPGTQSVPTFYTGEGQVISLPPAGNPVGTGDAAGALVPFPLDDTGFIVMSTGDATQADAPDRPGLFPDSDDGGPGLAERGLPGVASSARDVTVLEIPFDESLPDAGVVRLVRPALPLGGVPRAAGERLQRRLHRRGGCDDLDGDGLDDLGAGQLRCASERPAADDQGDGLRGHVARRSGRHALRRRHRAAARAHHRVPRRGAHALPLALRSRRQRGRQRGLHRRSHALDAGRRRLRRQPDSRRPARGHHGSRRGCDSRHAHADAHRHRAPGSATSRSGSTRAPSRPGLRCRRWWPRAPATRGRCPRRRWPRASTRRRPRRPASGASTA